MDPALEKLIADFEAFKSNVSLQMQKLMADSQRYDTKLEYRKIVAKGVNHALASAQSIDPGHHHTAASLDLTAASFLGYDLTKIDKIPQVVRLASTFTKSADTVMATITGMQWTLTAGKTYALKARLVCEASNVTGGIQLGLNGTATVSAILWSIFAMDDTKTLRIVTDSAALGTTFTDAGKTFYLVNINASFACSVSGTINIQFAQAVANGTSSVDHDSFAELILIS